MGKGLPQPWQNLARADIWFCAALLLLLLSLGSAAVAAVVEEGCRDSEGKRSFQFPLALALALTGEKVETTVLEKENMGNNLLGWRG